MDKKLSDNEIVKALDNDCLCVVYGVDCESCPLREKDCKILPEAIKDLIHRLQGENKQLKCDSYRTSWKAKFLEAKAEIERLTERETFLENAWKTSRESTQTVEIALKANRAREEELQKQVDELTDKLGKVLSGIKADELLVAKGIEQAVKDTAKEIFEKLLGYIGSQQQFCIVDEEHKTLIDCDKLFDFVGKLAKEKGVEVE